MLRISRLADYAIVIMVCLMQMKQACTAKDVALYTHLKVPTVSKLLKWLARAGLVKSQRGIKGGYVLAYLPLEISIAQIIQAIDGQLAITDCIKSHCSLEKVCGTRENWHFINKAILQFLETIRLSEMISFVPQSDVELKGNIPLLQEGKL